MKSPDHEAAAPALWRFWGPRYWSTWLLLAWLRIAAALPWRVTIAIHEQLGRVLWGLMRRRRKIVVRNLEICFPDLGAEAVQALAKRHFESLAVCLGEIAFGWFGSRKRLASLFRVEGLEHIQAALARGKGVVLFSGHFTTLEIVPPLIKSLVPRFAFMFTPRRNLLLNAMQARGRQRGAHVSMPSDDVRALLRELRKNTAIWYAPDQAKGGASGELVPFFGEPAMTSTATSRIAKISGAAIVPLFFCRLPDRAGYLLRFNAPLEGLPSDDAVHDTARLMGVIESFVRECPEQYFWIHRKFKGRPDALPDAYAESKPPAAASAPARRHSHPLSRPARGAVRDRARRRVHRRARQRCVVGHGTAYYVARRASARDHALAVRDHVLHPRDHAVARARALAPEDRRRRAARRRVAERLFHERVRHRLRHVDDPKHRGDGVPRGCTPVDRHAVLACAAVRPHSRRSAARVPIAEGLVASRLRSPRSLALLSAVLLVGTLYANYQSVVFFGRQNHSVRLYFNPGYPIYSLLRYWLRTEDRPPPERVLLTASVAPAHAARPKHTLLVFVVGETARADRSRSTATAATRIATRGPAAS